MENIFITTYPAISMVLIIKKTDLKNAVFNGWYATASYMILGENRQYSPG